MHMHGALKLQYQQAQQAAYRMDIFLFTLSPKETLI